MTGPKGFPMGVLIGLLCVGFGWGLGIATQTLMARRSPVPEAPVSAPAAAGATPPPPPTPPLADSLERNWQREVYGRALLAFREELAFMAQRHLGRLKAMELRHQDEDVSFAAARRLLQERTDEWNEYLRSGRYDLVRLQVTDAEVLSTAETLMAEIQAHAGDLRTGDNDRLRLERESVSAGVIKLQNLINRKLEAL